MTPTPPSVAESTDQLAAAQAAAAAASREYDDAKAALAVDPGPSSRARFTRAGQARAKLEELVGVAEVRVRLSQAAADQAADQKRQAERLAAQRHLHELHHAARARYGRAADALEAGLDAFLEAERETTAIARSEQAGLALLGLGTPRPLSESHYAESRRCVESLRALIALTRGAAGPR